MITIDELKAKLGGMKTAVDDLRDALSIEASEKRLAELEHQMTMPGFYDDQARSQKVISEMGEVKNKLERFGKLSTQYEEAETLLLMIEEKTTRPWPPRVRRPSTASRSPSTSCSS